MSGRKRVCEGGGQETPADPSPENLKAEGSNAWETQVLM